MALEHTSERPPPKPQRRLAVPARRDVDFPSEEPFEDHVAETKRHLEARTTLYLALVEERKNITIGSDQFVYFDADDPKKCLAPDVFVKVDAAIKDFDSWMIWERGAPQLAIEIVSNSDRLKLTWEEKFERYEATGIDELMRFDPKSQTSMRVWDRIDGKLIERASNRSSTYECKTLGLYWTVEMTPEYGRQLRLARDRQGKDLLPTPSEVNVQLVQQLADERHARSLAEHARLLAEQKQQQAEQKQQQAEQAQQQTEQKQREEAQGRLLAEQKQREEAQARTLAEQKQREEAQARLLAEQKQREEAQARLLAEQKQREEAQARSLAEQKQQQAEQKQREEAQARSLAEQKQREEAQARLLAEQKQREEAQARLLAEQKQREEAQAHLRDQAVAAAELERLRAEIERLRTIAKD